jgi:nicotinamidase/pyrazinamidase
MPYRDRRAERFLPRRCAGGAGGDEIVPGINALMADFDAVILTQDWHPAGIRPLPRSIPARRRST